MSCQLKFSHCDIAQLPFSEGDTVIYRNEERQIRSIYLRPFNENVNDIIVVFDNGDYTFHDDYELRVKG